MQAKANMKKSAQQEVASLDQHIVILFSSNCIECKMVLYMISIQAL